MSVKLGLYLLGYSITMAFSVVLFKLAATQIGPMQMNTSYWFKVFLHPYFILGVVLALGTRVFHYAMLTLINANTSILLASAGFVGVFVVSYFMLGETLIIREIIGCILILLGLLVIGI